MNRRDTGFPPGNRPALPVCGSAHHPAPAAKTEGAPSEGQLKESKLQAEKGIGRNALSQQQDSGERNYEALKKQCLKTAAETDGLRAYGILIPGNSRRISRNCGYRRRN